MIVIFKLQKPEILDCDEITISENISETVIHSILAPSVIVHETGKEPPKADNPFDTRLRPNLNLKPFICDN